MALYMVMGRYSASAMKSIVESGSNREDAARAAVEAAGGKLHSFYGMIGQEYQVAIIFEVPGVAEYIGAIAPAITGGVLEAWKTIPLYEASELVKGAEIARRVSEAYPGVG